MKKIILMFLMALSLSAAGNVNWVMTYKEGVEASKAQNKPMLLFMNRPECGACQFMKEDVFTDEMINTYINENYIPVSLNIRSNDAPESMQVGVTPVFHFVRADDSKTQESLVGGKTGVYFLKILKAGIAGY